MSIKATFPEGVAEVVAHGLTQWDYGQTLEIRDATLPALYEVHFACEGMTDAVVRVCEAPNGVASAVIPDRCLEQTTPVVAWIYEIDDTNKSGQTTRTIVLPIKARTKPQPAGSVPEEIGDKYTEAVTIFAELIKSYTEQSYASQAGYADTAGTAHEATHAATADKATSADHATEAGWAQTAGGAQTCAQADFAASAGSAQTCVQADFAARAACDGDGNNIAETYQKIGARPGGSWVEGILAYGLSDYSQLGAGTYLFSIELNGAGAGIDAGQHYTAVVHYGGEVTYSAAVRLTTGQTAYFRVGVAGPGAVDFVYVLGSGGLEQLDGNFSYRTI